MPGINNAVFGLTYIRVAFIAAMLTALTLSIGTVSQNGSARARQATPFTGFSCPAPESNSLEHNLASESSSSPADSLSRTSTYYLARPDLRRCASPLCGGYFVRAVNQRITRCANGLYKNECYVAEIDWNSHPQIEIRKALLRGNIVAKSFGRFSNLGALRVTESWEAASFKEPDATFYRVKDRGIRCIAFPCLTHHETTLNVNAQRNIAGVDLKGTGADDQVISEASTAMTGGDGFLVTGSHNAVRGPGGRALELKATQFYLRAGKQVSNNNPPNNHPAPEPPNTKPCFKTGCSSQVCSDENVITTCIWRSEYACYQKARCERQANGKCGFTMTRELTACLRSARP